MIEEPVHLRPWMSQLALHRYFTHPVKEDVKKKSLSRPLAGSQGW